ncbi:MAG: acyl-CoA desaturase, partial [Gammaproteobacteria bacterium]|nr:acyl-CoA desaturase [Gammaproteobacteria bacterium]
SYKAGRLATFIMALLGCTAGQRGPLWWASHHRYHHMTSDTDRDPHSPAGGFLNSHMLWFLRKGSFCTNDRHVRDWMKYPELRWLEKLDWLPFILFGAGCYMLGDYLAIAHPALNTDGPMLLAWGFFVSTVLLWHGTYTINSLAHRFGSRRFSTRDNSRNSLVLALLTLGEGWHNNHHRYPNATRQGFYWWEIDISYYLISLLSLIGLFRDMRPVPSSVYLEAMNR